MPASLWSGNPRLSLVLIPVKLHSAVSTEDAISFRMIHEPSGKPIRYVKGIPTEQGFEEVPEDEIIKGYEHAKGHHILIKPEELDELKLEAKHTIDMVRFVDEDAIDTRYLEKPYYLTPDGDDADEGYVVIRDALKQTRKVAIGQMVMAAASIWLASRRTAKVLCWSSSATHMSFATRSPTSIGLLLSRRKRRSRSRPSSSSVSQESLSPRRCQTNTRLPCMSISALRSNSARLK